MIRAIAIISTGLGASLTFAQIDPTQIIDPRIALSHLSKTGPPDRSTTFIDTADTSATATFWSPGGLTDLAMGNGLSTDILNLEGGHAMFRISLNGKAFSIGPGLTRQGRVNDPNWKTSPTDWPIRSLSLGTAHKWFSVPGASIWPPRGETATLIYLNPDNKLIQIEIAAEMMDGTANDAFTMTIRNGTSEPLLVGDLLWAGGDSNYLIRTSRSDFESNRMSVDRIVPPRSYIRLPRIIGAAAVPGAIRWPAAFTASAMPWTNWGRATAWVKCDDAKKAAALVDLAASLGFQRIAVQVEHGDLQGVNRAASNEASVKKIESAIVWDGGPYIFARGRAIPGDGMPCRASEVANNVVETMLNLTGSMGAHAFYDLTSWSHDCEALTHNLHQGKEDAPYAQMQVGAQTAQKLMQEGIGYFGREDLTPDGASGVVDPPTWTGKTPTKAEVAIDLARAGSLTPLVGLDQSYSEVVHWMAARQQLFDHRQLGVFAEAGRVAAAFNEGKTSSVEVVLAAFGGNRSGCKATVTVPLAAGTTLADGQGHSFTVSPQHTIAFDVPLAAGQVQLMSLKVG